MLGAAPRRTMLLMHPPRPLARLAPTKREALGAKRLESRGFLEMTQCGVLGTPTPGPGARRAAGGPKIRSAKLEALNCQIDTPRKNPHGPTC